MVYSDFNGTGKFGAGDDTLPNVTVYIDTSNSGKYVNGDPTTETGIAGEYEFSGLGAGSYIVRVELPSGYLKQTQPAGGLGHHINLGNGSTIDNEDFGITPSGSTVSGVVELGVSGTEVNPITVYLDANNNGQLDPGEMSTTTDSSGAYKFYNVPPGNYIIRQEVPTGQIQEEPANNYGIHISITSTPTDLPGFTFVDDDVTGSTIQGAFELDEGVNNPPEITVYLDANNNGKLDPGEISTTTDVDGGYVFSDVPAGNYIVRQVLPSTEAQQVPANDYGYHVTVPSTPTTLTIPDFQDVSIYGGITGYIYADTNKDGVQDAGDTALADVPVYIDLNNNGKYDSGEPETYTNSSGDYQFGGLDSGTYIVRVIYPGSFTQILPAGGLGHHATVVGQPGGAPYVSNENFLLSGTPASIHGTVEVTGASVSNLSASTVFIANHNSNLPDPGDLTTSVASDGTFDFDNLLPGSYYLRFAFVPQGLTQTTPSGGGPLQITLVSGEIDDVTITFDATGT